MAVFRIFDNHAWYTDGGRQVLGDLSRSPFAGRGKKAFVKLRWVRIKINHVKFNLNAPGMNIYVYQLDFSTDFNLPAGLDESRSARRLDIACRQVRNVGSG